MLVASFFVASLYGSEPTEKDIKYLECLLAVNLRLESLCDDDICDEGNPLQYDRGFDQRVSYTSKSGYPVEQCGVPLRYFSHGMLRYDKYDSSGRRVVVQYRGSNWVVSVIDNLVKPHNLRLSPMVAQTTACPKLRKLVSKWCMAKDSTLKKRYAEEISKLESRGSYQRQTPEGPVDVSYSGPQVFVMTDGCRIVLTCDENERYVLPSRRQLN